MVATPVFAGLSEVDTASLEASGVHFQCVVWRNVARNTIDARIETRGGNGERSVVWEGVIRDTEEDGAEAALADSPKVLALGGTGYFVVHWLEWEPNQDCELFRALFNTATVQNGWVLQTGGPTPQNGWHIWDHAPIREATPHTENEFVVVWIDSETTAVELDYGGPGIARYQSPYAWTDTVWSVTPSWFVMNRILALVGDDDADAVVGMVAQAAGYQLWGFQVDSADGLNPAAAQVGTGHANSEYTQAGACQIPGSSDAVVFAEYCTQANQATGGSAARSRGLLYREINLGSGGPSPSSSVQTAQNLHLGSRPWMRRSGFADEYEVYAYVTFKSLAEDQEWDQSYGYVVRGNRHDWGASVPANTIRLLPVSAITNGSVDGRSGGLGTGTAGGGVGFPTGSSVVGSTVNKRSNHVSSVAPGPQAIALSPDARSVSVGSLHFEQIIADQDSDAADGSRSRAQAAAKLIRFHHEDPWTVRDDAQDPDLPADDNFRGVARYSGGQAVELASGLLISGGVLSVYDGGQVVENGFLWAPEIVSVSAGPGGALAAGVYWYVANYRWVSPSGAIHRGPLSRPVQVTAAANDAATLVVRTIGLTLKDDRHLYPNAGRVMIEIWRTTLLVGQPEGAGAGEYLFRRLFHGATSGMRIEDTPMNNANAYAITVSDVQPDSVLQYADPLDWQLDTVSLQWNLATPIPTPALRIMAQRRNRLWGVRMDDPRVLIYSDEALPLGLQTAALEFFDANTYRWDSRGDVTGLQEMDNALLALTEDDAYSIDGEENDGTGTGATLQLQRLASGTGCIEPRATVLHPLGVMFQSGKGYYAMSRGQELDYANAGAAVEDLILAAGNIRAATLLQDRHEIRLACNAAPVAGVPQPQILVYNYEHKLWSRFDFPELVGDSAPRNAIKDACAWRGRNGEVCHVVLAEGGLAIERGADDASYTDEDYSVPQRYAMDVQTEWIHLAGMAGLKRVPRFAIQTERLAAGPMTVEAWYDTSLEFDETTPSETFTFATATPLLVCKPFNQKFTSVMIRVYESGAIPTAESVRLVSLTLTIGRKKGQRKVPAANLGVPT